MNNLLILEGPDGGGKTTLSQQLTGYHVRHHHAYQDEQNIAIHFFKSMMRAIMGHGNVMLDRSWLSEPIYGQVYRGGASRILAPHRRMLERVALSLNACVVLCYPPLENCIDSFNARREAELLESVDQLTSVHNLYSSMETSLPMVKYDYTKGDKAFNSIKKTVEAIHNSTPNYGPGIGRYSSQSVLLVGDQSNNQNHFFKRYNVPFISFTQSGCSWWLAEQLEENKLDESRLYWVNAYVNGAETDPSFIDEMNPLETIALGDAAATWLKNNDQAFIKAPHPQYWKRFHVGKVYPLMGIIDEALDGE